MSYDFNTLYQEWVDDLSPSTPSSKTTVESFIFNMKMEYKILMEEGEEIPDDLIWILNNIPS